jgi:hypothetical protein
MDLKRSAVRKEGGTPLLAGVTSLVVLWGLYQMVLLLLLELLPMILGGN